MNRFRRLVLRPSVPFISGSIVIFWLLYLFPEFNESFQAPGGPNVADLQLSWTVDRFVETLTEWESFGGASAIDGVRRQILVLDGVFPVAYALLGASLLAFTWPAETLSGRYLLAPVAAGLADYFENVLLLVAISGLPPVDSSEIPEVAVVLASAFAAVKFLLLFGVVSLAIFGAIRCVCRSRRERTSRAANSQ